MNRDGDRLIGWKAIAAELGVSEWDAKHTIYRAGLRFAKLKSRGRTSTVFVTRAALQALRVQLFRAKPSAM